MPDVLDHLGDAEEPEPGRVGEFRTQVEDGQTLVLHELPPLDQSVAQDFLPEQPVPQLPHHRL